MPSTKYQILTGRLARRADPTSLGRRPAPQTQRTRGSPVHLLPELCADRDVSVALCDVTVHPLDARLRLPAHLLVAHPGHLPTAPHTSDTDAARQGPNTLTPARPRIQIHLARFLHMHSHFRHEMSGRHAFIKNVSQVRYIAEPD